MLLNYEKYTLEELVDGVAWCDRCKSDTESTALVAKNQALPSFVICWNCHDVRQSGVGSLRAAELPLEPTAQQKCPTCSAGKLESVMQCDYCFQVFDNTDISNRSAGG